MYGKRRIAQLFDDIVNNNKRLSKEVLGSENIALLTGRVAFYYIALSSARIYYWMLEQAQGRKL
jgi:hypothetical protein